jgi:hypothetical protein
MTDIGTILIGTAIGLEKAYPQKEHEKDQRQQGTVGP